MNDRHPSACLSDVPGSPGAPEVKDKTKSSITLSWSPPDRDGGSPVKGYIIELHEEGSPDWRRVNPADKLHPSTEITVPDLKEGKKCKFRIYAVNAAGRSEPAKTADVLVQDILSEKNTLSPQTSLMWSPTRSSNSVFSLCPVEPSVTLDVSAHDLLNCRAGTTVRIPATITGRPVPKVTWTFDGAAETEKKNELHTLPVDSEVGSAFRQVRTRGW